HRVDGLTTEVDAALLPREAVAQQNLAYLGIGVVVRVAVVGLQGVNVHIERDGIHSALRHNSAALSRPGLERPRRGKALGFHVSNSVPDDPCWLAGSGIEPER